MSEILLVQIINFILQIIFDIISKFANQVCTDKYSKIAGDFLGSLLGKLK